MMQRTLLLSRLIGIYSLIVSLSMIVHKAAMIELVSELSAAPPLLFIGGLFALVAGLAMVLGHNVWTGGALPVVVTLVGWVILIRGIVLVFISPAGAAAIYEALYFAQLYYLYVANSVPPRGLSLACRLLRPRPSHREDRRLRQRIAAILLLSAALCTAPAPARPQQIPGGSGNGSRAIAARSKREVGCSMCGRSLWKSPASKPSLNRSRQTLAGRQKRGTPIRKAPYVALRISLPPCVAITNGQRPTRGFLP